MNLMKRTASTILVIGQTKETPFKNKQKEIMVLRSCQVILKFIFHDILWGTISLGAMLCRISKILNFQCSTQCY